MPSELALAYVSQLDRDEPVPTADVAALLEAAGAGVPDAWLDFHEHYAGYREPVAGEVAVWGLALGPESCSWFDPGVVYVTAARGVLPATVMCADVHPSHDYLLRADGRFEGPPFPCASFEVKVERNALMWDFTKDGGTQRAYRVGGVPVRELRDELLSELRPFFVAEASDRFARYYYGPDKLLLESIEHGTLKLAVRVDASSA